MTGCMSMISTPRACDDIIRETFDSAVRAGRSALEALGVHPYEAEKIVKTFVKGDRISLRKLARAL